MAAGDGVQRVLVKITRATRPYNVGETAAFVPRVAQRLVRVGGAVYLDPPKGFDEHGKPVQAPSEEGLRHNGGGWYELLDFTDAEGVPLRVHGKAAAIAERDRLAVAVADAQGDGEATAPEGGADPPPPDNE